MLYETERLVVRDLGPGDLDAVAEMGADPEVMRHFPGTLTRAESAEMLERFAARRRDDGFAFPAVELKSTCACIGFVGLGRVHFEATFAPAVEIGWRLLRRYWGQGYAKEAALAALDFGFEQLDLDEIVSFTATENTPSQAVMRSIGMTRDAAGDFDHPALPPGHRLRPHVLYRIRKPSR